MNAPKFKIRDRVVVTDRSYGPTEAGTIILVHQDRVEDGSSDWLYRVQFDDSDQDLFWEWSLQPHVEANDIVKGML